MTPITSLMVVVLLLLANGFFVAAEFALVKAHGFRMENLASEGSGSAKLVVMIQADLESYLAACQLGITMASLGLGWVGEPAVAHLLTPLLAGTGATPEVVSTASLIIGFLLFSSLHIVVGEQVPKTFAIRQPEPVAMWVARPLRITYLAVLPLNWLLNRATSGLLSLFGVSEASHGDIYSSDEIKQLVATSQVHGEIETTHASMLKNLFEFDQRQVSGVMIPRTLVHSLDIRAPAKRNLDIMQSTSHSRFPLIDSANDEAIIGILLMRDLHAALLAGKHQPWHELTDFARDALIVPDSQSVPRLFELMRQQREHMALVADEYGSFQGVITMEDLLEEIVGEIDDEKDSINPSSGIDRIDQGHWECDGLVSLYDVQKIIGLSVPAEIDVNTLSGLFMERLARMPEAGDEIIESNHRLQVLHIEARHVGRVTIEALADDAV